MLQNKEDYLNTEIKKLNNEKYSLQNNIRDLEKIKEIYLKMRSKLEQ